MHAKNICRFIVIKTICQINEKVIKVLCHKFNKSFNKVLKIYYIYIKII